LDSHLKMPEYFASRVTANLWHLFLV